MSTKFLGRGIALGVLLLGMPAVAGTATAAPLSTAKATASSDIAQGTLQPAGYRGWGGVGIYIGPTYGYVGPGYGYVGPYYPRYGYYPTYGYYDDDDYDYYPRRRAYYYDYGYDRPYRAYNRRWARERFEHPLGRR